MPATVNHVYTSPIADGTNTQLVRPSDWNSSHLMTLAPSGVEIIGAFSNANGISFGTSGPTSAVTASYTVPTVPAQTSLNFSNSNNVTFGINGSTVTASASYPAQTVDTNKAGIGYTSTTQAGSTVGATHNTQGLSMAWPPFLTTAQAPGAYLTTAALSDHSHGMVTTTTNGSNVTIAGNSGGYTLAVPPFVTAAAGGGDGYNIIGVNGAGTALSTTVQFNNGNNITFGLNAGTITASASYVNDLTSGRAGTGFTSTTTAGTAITAALGTNGLTFAQPAFLTTAAAVSASNVSGVLAGTASNGGTATLSGNVSFSNANGISFYTSAGNAVVGTVKTDYQSSNANYLTSQNAQALSGSNGSFTFQTATFGNSNGLLFYTTNGSIVGSYTVPAVPGATVFSNSNNVSFGLNGSTITATATVAADANKAGTGTTFAGANITGNMTLNTNGLNLSLSVAAPGAAAENNWFTLGGNVVGNSTASGSTIQLIAGNNITLSGTNDSQIQIIGPAAGGGNTISTFIPYYPGSTGAQTLGAQGATSASAFFWPVSIVENVKFNQIEMLMTNSNVSSATAAAGGQTITQHFGIYTINGGSALSILSSSSQSFAHTGNTGSATLSFPVSYGTAGGYTHTTTAGTGSAQIQSLWGTVGNRIVTWGFGNTMSLSPGLYIFGIHQRQTTSGFNIGNNLALAGNVMAAPQNAGPMGSYTTAWTGTGVFKWPWGIHTSTGSANYGGSRLPDSVLISAISKTMTIMPMCTIISR